MKEFNQQITALTKILTSEEAAPEIKAIAYSGLQSSIEGRQAAAGILSANPTIDTPDNKGIKLETAEALGKIFGHKKTTLAIRIIAESSLNKTRSGSLLVEEILSTNNKKHETTENYFRLR